jgi:hypothetical protein
MVQMLSPAQWALRQFGGVQLGDKRINQRAVSFAAAAAARPEASVPKQCGAWKDTKGAYRLMDNDKVSFEKLQQPHRRLTLAAAGVVKTVLWVSDTTTLSIDHPATEGLGPTSSGGNGSGMLLHSTLGVDVSGQGVEVPGGSDKPVVLGLGHQQVWAREGKAVPDPESLKWKYGIDAVGTPPPGVRWVHVGDCESDCWEAIESCLANASGFALRACQDRLVLEGHVEEGNDQPVKLFQLLRERPMLGGKHLFVRARPQQAARWAKLAISSCPVTLLAPKNWSDKPHRKNRPRPGPIRCWAVRVWEVEPPDGQDPVEWVIFTDEPADDLESAAKVANWYACRWLIEEYHKCLKTGCRIEERQLQEEARLERLLGVLAVVAVRLLQLKHQATLTPEAPAESVVPERYVRTMRARLKLPRRQKLTVYQFWRETAKMGGFLARKSDGEPGWITLWRGWHELELLTAGFELGEKTRSRCG